MTKKRKNSAAVSLGKRSRRLLSADRRSEIASLAARTRWAKQRKDCTIKFAEPLSISDVPA